MKAGWEEKRLGDVVTRLTNGYVGPTRNIYLETGVPYLLARHVRDNRLAFDGKTYISGEFNHKNRKSMLKAGDVLLVQSGHIGHSAVVTQEHEGHNCHAMIVITPVKDVVTGPFLSLYFNSPEMRQRFDEIRSGSTVPHLTCGAVKEMKIPLPPLPEQQRIVGILDEAFDGIATAKANAEQNRQNARALFESHLQSVFTQRGEGWMEKKMGDVCEVKDGTHDSPKYVADGIPFVTQKNIREDGLSFVNTRFISQEDHEKFYKRSNVAFGDILISMIGANRGMSCIVDDDRVFSIKNVGLVKRNDAINPHFLLYFLKSSGATDYVRLGSKGGAQEFIGLTELRRFPLILPALSRQNALVAELYALSAETQRLESIYQQKFAALDELKKSLLHQAFTGQL